MTLNNYVQTTAAQSHFSVDRDNMYILLNCEPDEVQRVLKKKIARNLFELGLSQNLLDLTNFESFQLELAKSIKFALAKFNVPGNVEEQLNKFGLMSIRNHLGPV